METKGMACNLEAWEAKGAEVKASFDTTPVKVEFTTRLEQQLAKAGLSINQAGPGSPVRVKGKFVRIDEGNRLLRYFLGYAAGAGEARLEVEGDLIVDGKKLADLYAASKSGGLHLFGGAAEGLLKTCAQQCARSISKQILAEMKRSERGASLPAEPDFSPASGKQRTRRQWIAAGETRLKDGTPAEALLQEIIQDGYPQAAAEVMLGEAIRTLNQRSWKVLGCSTLLLLAGILVTISTYSTAAAQSTGGTYIVWFGAVICGLVGIIYGLRTFVKRQAA